MSIKDGRFADLRRLARLHGIQTSYFGTDHRRRTAPAESLLAVLKALGAPVDTFRDVPAALREKKLALARRVLEPVSIVKDGRGPEVKVCLPDDLGEADGECRLETEGGGAIEWRWRAAGLTAQDSGEVEGERYLVKGLPLPRRPPHGYHRLILQAGGYSYDTLLISAPEKTYQPPEEARRWGVFLPL
jgi:4-alpha-glucanotransferase